LLSFLGPFTLHPSTFSRGSCCHSHHLSPPLRHSRISATVSVPSCPCRPYSKDCKYPARRVQSDWPDPVDSARSPEHLLCDVASIERGQLMASAASIPSPNLNPRVNSPQNNGLGRNTMRSTSNQKAVDAGRKQSPGGGDAVSRYNKPHLTSSLPDPGKHLTTRSRGAMQLIIAVSCTTFTPSLLLTETFTGDRLRKPGVQTRTQASNEVQWLPSKMDTRLRPEIRAR